MRKPVGVDVGDELIARVEGVRIILEPRKNVLKRMRNRFFSVPSGRKLADELIAERRPEAAREGED